MKFAIPTRILLSEFVFIVKLTVWPFVSSRIPSPLVSFQPRLASRRFDSSRLKSYFTMSGECQIVAPAVRVDQFFTASPKKMLGIIASRSTAIETARRNVTLLNQLYFTGSTTGAPTFFPPSRLS